MSQCLWVSVPSISDKEVLYELASFPENTHPSVLEVLDETSKRHSEAAELTISPSHLCILDREGKELASVPMEETSAETPLQIAFTREGLASFGINELRSMAARIGIKAKGNKQHLIDVIYLAQRNSQADEDPHTEEEEDEEEDDVDETNHEDINGEHQLPSLEQQEQQQSTSDEREEVPFVEESATSSDEIAGSSESDPPIVSTTEIPEEQIASEAIESANPSQDGEDIVAAVVAEPTIITAADDDEATPSNEPIDIPAQAEVNEIVEPVVVPTESEQSQQSQELQQEQKEETPQQPEQPEQQQEELSHQHEPEEVIVVTNQIVVDTAEEVQQSDENSNLQVVDTSKIMSDGCTEAGTPATIVDTPDETTNNDNASEESLDLEFTFAQLRLMVNNLKERATNMLSKDEIRLLATRLRNARLLLPTDSPSSPIHKTVSDTKGKSVGTPSSIPAAKPGVGKRPLSPKGNPRPYSPRRDLSKLPPSPLKTAQSTSAMISSTSKLARPAQTIPSASSSQIRPRSPVPPPKSKAVPVARPDSSDSAKAERVQPRSRSPIPTTRPPVAPRPGSSGSSKNEPVTAPARPRSPRPNSSDPNKEAKPKSNIRPRSPVPPSATAAKRPSSSESAKNHSTSSATSSSRPGSSESADRASGIRPPTSATKSAARSTAETKPGSARPKSPVPSSQAHTASSRPKSPKPATNTSVPRPRSPRPPSSTTAVTDYEKARPTLNRLASTRGPVIPTRGGSAGDVPSRSISPKPNPRRASIDSPGSVSSDSAASRERALANRNRAACSQSVGDASDLVAAMASEERITSTTPFATDLKDNSPLERRGSQHSISSDTSNDSRLSGTRSLDSQDDPNMPKRSTASVIRGAKPPAGRLNGTHAKPNGPTRNLTVGSSLSRTASQSRNVANSSPSAAASKPVSTSTTKTTPHHKPMRSISQPTIHSNLPVRRVTPPPPAPAPAPAPTVTTSSTSTTATTTTKPVDTEPEPLPEVFRQITAACSPRSTSSIPTDDISSANPTVEVSKPIQQAAAAATTTTTTTSTTTTAAAAAAITVTAAAPKPVVYEVPQQITQNTADVVASATVTDAHPFAKILDRRSS